MSQNVNRRLNPAQKRKIKKLWESGEFTLEQIGEEVGVTKVTVHRYVSKNNIVKGSAAEDYQRQVEEEMEARARQEAEELHKKVVETKSYLYRMQKAIDDQMAHEIVSAIKEKRSISSAIPAIKAAKIASDALKSSRENRWAILGLDKEQDLGDDLPTLAIEELSEEEMEEIRNAQEDRTLKLSSPLDELD